jgi:hypothetical protein
VRALQIRGAAGEATQVSVQRVCGALDGRAGAFVLQGEGRICGEAVEASWFVVPGTGVGELCGLRGEGGFTGRFGQGSAAWLDYWFEWDRRSAWRIGGPSGRVRPSRHGPPISIVRGQSRAQLLWGLRPGARPSQQLAQG